VVLLGVAAATVAVAGAAAHAGALGPPVAGWAARAWAVEQAVAGWLNVGAAR